MLVNFVRLEDGKPTRVHFTDHYWIDREIATGEGLPAKTVRSLTLQVDRLEGAPFFGTLSFLSVKAIEALRPFLPDKRYMSYEFVYTKEGSGFSTEYRMLPILITPERASELAAGATAGESQRQAGSPGP